MDKLTELQAGFAHENDSFAEASASRKVILDGYAESLRSVRKEVDGIVATHKNEVVKLLDEKDYLTKDMLREKEVHAAQLALLIKNSNEKSAEIAEKEKKVADLNSQVATLNRNIDILMAEHREVDGKIGSLRVNLSIADRQSKEATESLKILDNSLESKRAEEMKLTADIESKQKQHARLSNDIAILEARKHS